MSSRGCRALARDPLAQFLNDLEAAASDSADATESCREWRTTFASVVEVRIVQARIDSERPQADFETTARQFAILKRLLDAVDERTLDLRQVEAEFLETVERIGAEFAMRFGRVRQCDVLLDRRLQVAAKDARVQVRQDID